LNKNNWRNEKRSPKKDVIVKRFLAKKPNGEKEWLVVHYDRLELNSPIYLLRSE